MLHKVVKNWNLIVVLSISVDLVTTTAAENSTRQKAKTHCRKIISQPAVSSIYKKIITDFKNSTIFNSWQKFTEGTSIDTNHEYCEHLTNDKNIILQEIFRKSLPVKQEIKKLWLNHNSDKIDGNNQTLPNSHLMCICYDKTGEIINFEFEEENW